MQDLPGMSGSPEASRERPRVTAGIQGLQIICFGGLGPPQVTRVSLLRARARDKGIHIGRGLPDRSSRWRPDPGISGTQGPSRSWDRSWRVLCLLELVRHSSVWFSVLSYTW